MSHRHSAQLQRQSNTELPLDVIWKCVESVWTDTVSAEVARSCISMPLIRYPYKSSNLTPFSTPRSFILAYRIMKLIIAEQGNNSWLAHGTPHLNVRTDYVDTATGIKRKNTFGGMNM